MNKLYHVSKTPNIKILMPRVSTHGKAYVYATDNLELALLFGSSKSYGDFDGMYGTIDNKPYFYEAYPFAFKRRFEGEKCYIYEVDGSSFKSLTNFKSEVVSEVPVNILGCTEVDDLYGYFNKLIADGKLIFKEYSQDKKYKKMIEEHIKERIIRFKILDQKESNAYRFCKQHFQNIVDELEINNRKIKV